MAKKLLVIIPDYLSSILEKGEFNERYYNPGNLFDEVHIMMTNHDQPDCGKLQKTVGKARLVIHNYPEPLGFFKKTLGWRPWLMNKWAKGAVEIARQINPSLIRCHGPHLNTFLAAKIKEALDIPYVVSLHINPDENFRKYAEGYKQKIASYCLKGVEKIGLRSANLVMPVYEPIISYLNSLKIKNYVVCYNVVNANITPKQSYELSSPARILCVGRLINDKNPINIIKVVKDIPDVHLTIVGLGPIKDTLMRYVASEKMGDKVAFIDSMDNAALSQSLSGYDIVALHSEYYEFSKVMIETGLAGVPLLLNYRKDKKQVPELGHNNCIRVENSYRGYFEGLKKLLSSAHLRKEIGQAAQHFAASRCSPTLCEEKYVSIYERYMKR